MIEEALEYLITHSPALIVAVPLLGAFLTPLIGKIGNRVRNGFAVFIVLLTSFLVFLLVNDVFTNGIRTYTFGSSEISSPVVRILFEIDGLNAFMAIVAIILSLVGIIYTIAFIKENTGLDKYYTLMLLLIAGLMGMILTGDMFNFFVFLEITSISAAALIAFWTNKEKSVLAGFKFIVISSIGALFVLFAIALLYGQYNALNMAVIANNIQYTFIDKIALVLLIAALAMKSGIVPMHMWLPDAYGRAPSSVTIVLIGTTLASFYGFLRITFTVYGKNLFETMNYYSPNILLGVFFVILSIATILIGVLMALRQKDLKRMIAFSAVAEIGFMLLAIGAALTSMVQTTSGAFEISSVGTQALRGGVFHILNDALDIGLLFLVAGAVFYAAKETLIDKLGGLARNLKYTTVFFIIGLLAVSGIPPLNGFASKLIIYQSTYQINPILAVVAILSSILLLAVFVKVFYSVFLGPKLPKFEKTDKIPKSMLLAMGIIAVIIVFFGLFPDLVIENLVNPAVEALKNSGEYVSAIIGGGI